VSNTSPETYVKLPCLTGRYCWAHRERPRQLLSSRCVGREPEGTRKCTYYDRPSEFSSDARRSDSRLPSSCCRPSSSCCPQQWIQPCDATCCECLKWIFAIARTPRNLTIVLTPQLLIKVTKVDDSVGNLDTDTQAITTPSLGKSIAHL